MGTLKTSSLHLIVPRYFSVSLELWAMWLVLVNIIRGFRMSMLIASLLLVDWDPTFFIVPLKVCRQSAIRCRLRTLSATMTSD